MTFKLVILPDILRPEVYVMHEMRLAVDSAARLPLTFVCAIGLRVKTVDFNAVKRQEARSRMAAARRARRSPQAAAALQRQGSLVGDGARWRITNFKQVARAMSRWA